QSVAVNESVELVKRARKRSAAPLVNAVLRRVAERPERVKPAGGLPFGTTMHARLVAESCAHPVWLVERWVRFYGIEETFRLCLYDQRPPQTALRVHGDARAITEELQRDGVELAPGGLLASARRVVSGDVTKTAAWREGRVAIQDEA